MDFTRLPLDDLKSESAEVKLPEADVQQADLQRVPVAVRPHRGRPLIHGPFDQQAVPDIRCRLGGHLRFKGHAFADCHAPCTVERSGGIGVGTVRDLLAQGGGIDFVAHPDPIHKEVAITAIRAPGATAVIVHEGHLDMVPLRDIAGMEAGFLPYEIRGVFRPSEAQRIQPAKRRRPVGAPDRAPIGVQKAQLEDGCAFEILGGVADDEGVVRIHVAGHHAVSFGHHACHSGGGRGVCRSVRIEGRHHVLPAQEQSGADPTGPARPARDIGWREEVLAEI